MKANPNTDADVTKAFQILARLCDNKDELYVIIATLRTFFEVKHEYEHQGKLESRLQGIRQSPALHIVKKNKE